MTDSTAYTTSISTVYPEPQSPGSLNRLSSGREVNSMSKYFIALRKDEEGQTMAEYGVVLAVITIGAVAVFTALSGGITGAINSVIDLLPG